MDIYNNREDALQFCNEIMSKMFVLVNEMDRIGDFPCLNTEERKNDDDLTFGELWKELTGNMRTLCEAIKASVLIQLSWDSGSTENMKEVSNLLENVSKVIEDGHVYSKDEMLDGLDEIINYAKESAEEESDDEEEN